jgi:hypothetical protein
VSIAQGTPRIKSQKALVQCLNADLDHVLTFLQTAKIEAGWDDEHCRAALVKAHLVLDTVRRFQGRIESPGDWEALQKRADQIQAAIEAFGR